VAAQHAFESGMRAAVLISAALFALGALYTWWRGPAPVKAGENSGEVAD
jgi:hypothetical protein